MHFRKNDMIGNCLNKGSSIAMKKKNVTRLVSLKEKILGRQLEGRKFNYKEKFFYIISTNLLVYPLVDFYVNCFVRFYQIKE